ncbi:MAG: ABC transporter ATP-binding protein [Candidatus Eisenbacteria bacterium]|nr:ABC transporter ATP-binding protein [Candidatus Eisenbacteria bacterium]
MTILELKSITKFFGGVCAVDHVSMGFRQGRITGLIGPNGAGKTTIFNLISGFLYPDEGKTCYCGSPITGLAPWQIARMGIGRAFQDVHLFMRMKVLDNVLVGFQRQTGENPLMALLARPKVNREEKSRYGKTMELLRFVGLADKADDMAENLSYGQQKLLSIARLLAADADVMLLDEPTAGVNPTMVGSLLDVIRKLTQNGKTVIFIEHNMNVVIDIADWVYFLDEGQVTAFGQPNEVLCDPEVRRAYIGI